MRKLIVPAILIFAAVLMGIVSYPYLPEEVPIHWNASGEPDNYASKAFALFFMPAVMLFVYLLISIVQIIDPRRKNIQKFGKNVDIINYIIMFVLLIVHGMTILYGLGREINMSVVAPGITGILFIVIGNYMPRFKLNYFIGIRTPWTLANEKVWTRTHQLGGKIFVIGGLLLLLTALLPPPWNIIALILIVLAIVLIPALFSFKLYKKQQQEN